MAGFRGAGKVFLSVNNSGTYTGYLDMANVANFTVGNDGGEEVTLKSTAPVNYGAVIGSASTPGDDTITIALNVPNRKNLAVMLLGTDTGISNTGAVVTDQTYVAKQGAYIALAHRKLTSFERLDAAAGSSGAAFSGTTDYTVDLTNGLIYIKTTAEGGTITDGSTVYADYTHPSYTGYKIDARTRSNIDCKVLFVGQNLDNSEYVRLTADSVSLTPEGEFQLISPDNEFLEFTLSGTIKVPTGQTVPFVMEVIT
jgi:hypothetical protein